MPSSHSSDDPQPTSEPTPSYKLPIVENFDGVNQNFDALAVVIKTMATAMEQHAETTNTNLTKLAEETSENLNKLADDLKAVFSSQVMMITICVLVVSFAIIALKSIWDIIQSFT